MQFIFHGVYEWARQRNGQEQRRAQTEQVSVFREFQFFRKLDEGRSVPFCEGIPLVHVEGTLGSCFLMSVQREPDSTRSAS